MRVGELLTRVGSTQAGCTKNYEIKFGDVIGGLSLHIATGDGALVVQQYYFLERDINILGLQVVLHRSGESCEKVMLPELVQIETQI